MAQVEGSVILGKTYMARVPFKHNGTKFKSFDEIVPADLKWTVQETVNLVKAGRIMPFDHTLDAEVFYEIPAMQRRSPLGISAAEMRDVVSSGKLDEATDGVYESDLKAASKLFTTHCYDLMGNKIPTFEANITTMSFDNQAGVKTYSIPAGADGSPEDELTEEQIVINGKPEESTDDSDGEENKPTGPTGSGEAMMEEEGELQLREIEFIIQDMDKRKEKIMNWRNARKWNNMQH